jgi:putative DNA primase/helicase
MSGPERGPAGTWQYLAFWDHGQMALETTRANLPVDDATAVALLDRESGGGLHYATSLGQWHIWNGQAHPPDISGEIEKIVIGLGIRLREVIAVARGAVEASVMLRMEGDKQANITAARDKALAEWAPAAKYAAGLLKTAGRNSLVSYLAAQLGVSDEYMDERRPHDLNFPNGTLDLASLDLRRQQREDMITYVLPDPWEPRAQCPRFWDLIWRVSGRDMEVASFIIKALGYSMLGDNREQKIIFMAGPSGSGKSVLLHCVSEVLGPLAHRAQADLICVVRHGRNARTENSVRGKRFVTITETSKFMNIDEGQLKRITGEPVISVNQHYSKTEIKTKVTWTIWVATNDMPSLVNFDAAMRRRVLVIPTGPGLPEWEMDTQLAAKILSTERQGIMALLARGAAEYFRSGLIPPAAVVEATEEYASEQNTVTAFLSDTMTVAGWGKGISQHQAWEIYQQWSRGSTRLTRPDFYKHMRSHPGVTYNSVSRRFEGIAWNDEWATRVNWVG